MARQVKDKTAIMLFFGGPLDGDHKTVPLSMIKHEWLHLNVPDGNITIAELDQQLVYHLYRCDEQAGSVQGYPVFHYHHKGIEIVGRGQNPSSVADSEPLK